MDLIILHRYFEEYVLDILWLYNIMMFGSFLLTVDIKF